MQGANYMAKQKGIKVSLMPTKHIHYKAGQQQGPRYVCTWDVKYSILANN